MNAIYLRENLLAYLNLSSNDSTTNKQCMHRLFANEDHKHNSTLEYFCNPIHSKDAHGCSFFTLTDTESMSISNGVCSKFISPNSPEHIVSLCLLTKEPFLMQMQRLLVKLIVSLENIDFKDDQRSSQSVWITLLENNADSQHPGFNIINNLLSVPSPKSGQTLVQILISPSLSPVNFALPNATRLPLVDIPLHFLLEFIGTKMFVDILSLLLLEQKVLFVSDDYKVCSKCVIAMISLLYPLQYMFPIIPLLPNTLPYAEQLLQAPTPFFIGVTKSFIHNDLALHSDIWILNLDTGKLNNTNKDMERVAIPELVANSLIQGLDTIMKDLNNESVDGDEVDINLRILMVNFFGMPAMLEHIEEHTRIIRLLPRPVVAFQRESFVHSRRLNSRFIEKLSKTQAIEYLAEWLTCPTDTAYLRIRTGITDAKSIGDKCKWFMSELIPLKFSLSQDYTSKSMAVESTMISEESRHSDLDSIDSSLNDLTLNELKNIETAENKIPLSDFNKNAIITEYNLEPQNNSQLNLLTDASQLISNGIIQSWNHSRRLSILMRDECYRNFLLSKLNEINIKRKYHTGCECALEPQHLDNGRYNAALKLISAIINGLEFSYLFDHCNKGIASTFQLLEYCSTHYCKQQDEDVYLCDRIALQSKRSPIWDKIDFWEISFLDALAQEREILGLDQCPTDELQRYKNLSTADQKKMELEEDELLMLMLSNMISFMVRMHVKKEQITRKLRRLLGRCHICFEHTQKINSLLSSIDEIKKERISEMLPILPCRLRHRLNDETLLVHINTNSGSDPMLLELIDDAMLLWSEKNTVQIRLFYQDIVSLSFNEATNTLCIWRRQSSEINLLRMQSSKVNQIYKIIVDKVNPLSKGTEMNDNNFNIMKDNEPGLLQISANGVITIHIEGLTQIMDPKYIRRLSKLQDDLFVIELFDPEQKRICIRTYKSDKARQICIKFIEICSVLSAR
ncbi:hypothetical protein GJ496_001168 [Pomphorhynchus laevis]|nr:hypothetical protein GJ496_001168 [Pomphorhynchus laevis]